MAHSSLTICIPIFNKDVRDLVLKLVHQCQVLNLQYQVLCFDDASKEKYKQKNRSLETVYGVSYLEFSKNLGRAKMRNKLGFHAMYENLLFLDCDSQVVTKKFIKNYINELGQHDVLYGGTRYQKKKPKSISKVLHWTYGQKREKLSLDKRKKHPHAGFRSNNFLIKRDVFLKYPFDERIEGYGHEDTLFAQILKKNKIHIHHIENAVKHGGLEKGEKFLSKVEESIVNLVDLSEKNIWIETSLKRFYDNAKDWGILGLLLWVRKRFDEKIKNNLLGKNPNMYLLDLWKLERYDREVEAQGGRQRAVGSR